MLNFIGTLLVLISVTGAVIAFLFFDNKCREYKRHILSLSNQIAKLKSSGATMSSTLKTPAISNKNITVIYSTPTYSYGITSPYTAVYLSPIEYSFIINKLRDKTMVILLDEAEIDKEIWYYVSLDINTNINSKGWIRKSQISMFTNDSSNITSKSYR